MAKRIDRRVDIGHVHLKVADLERSIAFYAGVLGFEVTQRLGHVRRRSSAPAATTITSASTPGRAVGGPAPAPGTTGLYHFAIRYPDRAALGDALRRLREAVDPARRRERPRRQRGALPPRSGRQRRRALSRPAEGAVAARRGRLADDEVRAARSRGAAARGAAAEQSSCGGAGRQPSSRASTEDAPASACASCGRSCSIFTRCCSTMPGSPTSWIAGASARTRSLLQLVISDPVVCLAALAVRADRPHRRICRQGRADDRGGCRRARRAGREAAHRVRDRRGVLSGATTRRCSDSRRWSSRTRTCGGR